MIDAPSPGFFAGQAKSVLAEIRKGRSLKQACRGPKRPSPDTFNQWLKNPFNKVDHESIWVLYRRALRDRADAWQEEAANIVTTLPKTASPEEVRAAKARADFLFKAAKELAPDKTWDEKHAGEGVTVVVQTFAEKE